MGKQRTGRAAYAPIEGVEHRIWRRKQQGSDTEWERSPDKKDASYDSLCHRYVREVGSFRRDDDVSAAAAANVNAVAASGAAANSARDNGSKKAVEYQANLECFVIKHMPGTDYGKFVKSLEEIVGRGNSPTAAHLDPANRLKYVPIDVSSLSGYLKHLKHDRGAVDPDTGIKGRGCVWPTINGVLAGISKAQWQFGFGHIPRAPMAEMLGGWEDDWNKKPELHDQAPAFDIVTDMPKLRDAVFSMPGLSDDERRELWHMLLVDMNCLGRASDITDDYCPLLGDIEFPKSANDYLSDSLPSSVKISWTAWKGRPARTKYPLKMYSNQIDAWYDVVFWTMHHISVLKKSNRFDPTKPIWTMTSDKYQKTLKRVFKWAANAYNDDRFLYMSSHFVRRSAARWARRCGASDRILLEVGRWKDWNQLKTYLGEGEDDVELDEDGKDPVLKFWVFKTEATKAWQEGRAGGRST